MIDLTHVIRSRIASQTGGIKTLQGALDRSVWIAGRFGLIFRVGNPIRAPLKRLSESYKVVIGNSYRIVNGENLKSLKIGRENDIHDEIISKLIDEAGISRQEMAKELDITVKQLNYLIRKLEKDWEVLKVNELIYPMISYLGEPSTDHNLVYKILEKYPYLTVDQLSFITNLSSSRLASAIASLTRSGELIRGITRQEIPDELFRIVKETVNLTDEVATFVLENRDCLVEILKLERDIVSHKGDYWIFVHGLPQAEFNLRKEKKQYFVRDLHRFSHTKLGLPEILQEIVSWGKIQSMDLVVDHIRDDLAQSYQKLTQFLINRGYQSKMGSLMLSSIPQVQETREMVKVNSEFYSWTDIGLWLRNRQFLDYDGSGSDILYHIGQVDDVHSIAYRLDQPPKSLDWDSIIYIAGIDHRLGFVHKKLVQDIVKGWPKRVEMNYIDQKILGQLIEPMSTDDLILSSGVKPTQIRQRLRYLERTRVIRRDIQNGPLAFESCLWIKFSEGLSEIQKPIGGKRELASVGVFLIKLLETNPPLTKTQMSKYLGIQNRELEPLLETFVRKRKLLEGYYLEKIGEKQYTIPEILDTMGTSNLEREDLSAIERVDLLPASDPYALLHLYTLVIENPNLLPTERYRDGAEQWIILWDGIPVGYLIKQPSDEMLIDYEIDLKLLTSMEITTVISGALQKLVYLYRVWYNDEGKIRKINDVLASDNKWKHIHFLIESIGIKKD